MRRHSLILTAIVATITTGSTWAASKSDKADRVVDAVLQLEARGMVARREDDLGGAIDESDRARWAAGYIRSTDGWQKYDANVRMDDRLREYQDRRGTEALTPRQHLELANWCRDRKLNEQERAHLWSVVTSQSDQVNEWRRLGLEFVHGTWLTHGEKLRLEQNRQRWERNQRLWSSRAQYLKRGLSDSNPKTQETARGNLKDIGELEALPALESELSTSSLDAALAFVDWLKTKPQVEATTALARQSFQSPWEVVRISAAEALSSRRFDHSMPLLLNSLSTPVSYKVQTGLQSKGKQTLVAEVVSEREGWDHIERRSYHVIAMQLHLTVGRRTGRVTTRISAVQPTDREMNDLRRQQAEFEQRVDVSGGEFNREINQRNDYISRALSNVTGQSAKQTPEEWWTAWSSLTSTDLPSKSVVEVQESEVVTAPPRITFTSSCLPAGTPIMTSTGLQPIESIRIGDTVLAKDIETGELSYKPVIRTTVRKPQPLMTLHTKEDSIRATLGHYFWVSGQGWRMAKEIKPGHRLHGVQGTVMVTDVTAGGNEAVYNLVVEGANSYFVGECRILSHDVTPPVPTDIVVPGLAAR